MEKFHFEKEKERLNKEKKKAISEIKRVEGKLNNPGFMNKAPDKLIEEEKQKKEKFEEMLKTIEERLAKFN